MKKVSIESNIEIAPDVFVLRFKRDFNFIPGQVIGITNSEELSPRLYSIASGNNSELIEILYDKKPDGVLTPCLSDLNKGEYIFVTEPKGKFIDKKQKSYWIATGTGLAPFVSMLRSGIHSERKLIHGGRYLHSFYFQDELKEVLSKENYVRCCTQEKSESIYSGRLTQYLSGKELPKDHLYYLCGSSEMVVQVRDLLIDKNIPYEQIVSEIYF